MKVLNATGGIASTNCFVIADEIARQAVLFDAPDNTVAPLLDEVATNGWELIGLWLTHGHFDHVADHQVVKDRFPEAKILIHRLDERMLIEPNMKFFPLPFTIPSGRADAYVEDQQLLSLGSLQVRVFHTPGHSRGHVCYYFENENILIGGDLIICGAIGRTDLPGCDEQEMALSLKRIAQLPGATRILPGHCESTTISEELRTNPYLRQT